VAVGAEFGDRALGAGEHDRDVDAFEEEAERRRRVGHGVGAVEHDHPACPGACWTIASAIAIQSDASMAAESIGSVNVATVSPIGIVPPV
jgi:hypothetical protein